MKTLQSLTLIAAGTLLFSACGNKEQEKTNFAPETISVKVANVSTLQSSTEITATGLLTTDDEATYSFKIGGVIEKILVKEGQFFKKGQLLATLNATEIGAGLQQANLAIEKADRDYKRAVNLHRDSVFTLEQLQNTKTALDVAKKAGDAVAFNARFSKIYAESDGFVSKKMANEGEVIDTGKPVLSVNLSKANTNFVLKVGVTDIEWALVTIGQSAKVTLDGYPGKTFDASVLRKSQSSDAASGSFQIELKVNLGNVTPAVGMFGKAIIKTSQKEDLIAIPYATLVEADGDKAFIFVPDGNDRVRRLPITIRRFDSKTAYVAKDALAQVSEIVISNSAYLNERSKITIIR